MKVAVLGYGVEGQSATRYYQGLGEDVTICDNRTDIKAPSGIKSQLGSDYLQHLDQFDLIIRSPSIRPDTIYGANPDLEPSRLSSVTSQFLENCPAPIIGVTGTKGKGTTSTLIAKILEAAGYTVHLGGNIGNPALDFLSDVNADDYVILELSSFQLMDVTRSPHIAIMLMISPDHQDWHPDMAEYVTAKQNIFKYQGAGDRAIYNACNVFSLQSGLEAPADQTPYNAAEGAWVEDNQVKIGETVICHTDEIGLIGRHNWDNVCAAVTATWPIVHNAALLRAVIHSFTGLQHRLKEVATANGVVYVDDSISTNPQTAIAALQAFDCPKVVILGGADKKASYDSLAAELAPAQVKKAVLLGETAPQIRKALDVVGFRNYVIATDMDAAVTAAARTAQPGDIVLLSPGCASFDMFKNYQDRGDQFAASARAQ